MTAVFLDTVGLLATWDVRDQWHHPARAAFELIKQSGAGVITTTFVLAECGNAVSCSNVRCDFLRFGNAMEAGGSLLVPSDADWHEAWARYEAGFPGAAGLVDELSFAVMRRLGLQRAFTNDGHFADAGFEPLF